MECSDWRLAATRHGHTSRSTLLPLAGAGAEVDGASAGGLEAFKELLQHLPTQSGMAFVLVQHLDPLHASLLTELLTKATPMPVTQVRDGTLGVVRPARDFTAPEALLQRADISPEAVAFAGPAVHG
jgi:two-component system CheB/CheR fusion protein